MPTDSLLAAALADIADGNLSDVPSGDLLTGSGLNDVFTVTHTFWSAWQLLDLPDSDRARTLAVMRGVATEPRHPAYRTTSTGQPHVYECKAGSTVLLTLHVGLADGADADDDPLAAPGDQVWLTVAPARTGI